MRNRCWECVRRRRVCDSGKPACRKCLVAGNGCPGYGDKKPVTFLAPGQVRSKQHRGQSLDQSAATSIVAGQLSSGPNAQHNPPALLRSTVASARPSYLANTETAAPDWRTLRTDQDDLVQAVTYLNERFLALYKNAYIAYSFFHIPLEVLPLLPSSMHHAMTVLALSNRTLSVANLDLSGRYETLRSRQQYHTWRAVSCLNSEISKREAEGFIENFNCIIWFMMIELYCDLSPCWRPHLQALQHLIDQQGGLRPLYERLNHMHRMINIFVFDSIISNTTSPATNLFEAAWHAENVEWIVQNCANGDYPTFPCPQPLLADLIIITYLRSLAGAGSAAAHVMRRINSFSAEEWSLTKPSHQGLWKRIAESFQSAIGIYAIATLIDTDTTVALPSHRAEQLAWYRQSLLRQLTHLSNASVLVKFGITWPVIIAGYTAVDGSTDEREQVRVLLTSLGRSCGIVTPFCALRVLETFWESGKSAWDDCFNVPYAFVV